MVGGPHDNTQVGATWVFAPFAGTPGTATCVGQSITTLIREFGGINAAAAGTGFPSVSALQNAIMAFCEGQRRLPQWSLGDVRGALVMSAQDRDDTRRAK
jgi:hypothetical protein